ncbi:MAG: OmpA family protein [Candidatus Dependentiae bacterium]|nr:OmpA family protein [Candidatus Dependentiae bacterium]
MKRLLPALLLLLALASGCHKKSSKKPTTTESVEITQDEATTATKPEDGGIFLDEEIDKLPLQEEEKTPDMEKAPEVAEPEEPKIEIKQEPINAFAPAEIKKGPAVSLFEEEEAAERAAEAKRSAEQRKHGLKTIYFDFDRYTIRKDQEAALNHNLAIIKKLVAKKEAKHGQNIAIKLVSEGHACRYAGSDVYNMVLSEKRARAVTNWLVKHGIKRTYIKVVGRGYELCIVPEGSKEEQAPNRRVELYVLK